MSDNIRTKRQGDLFDFMVMTPQGATVDDITEHLGCSYDTACQTIRDLRITLGESAPDGQVLANLTANKQGPQERWLYKLVTDLEDHREWLDNRVRDLRARLETSQAVLASAVHATDGRTVEGKVARIMSKQIGRMMEDLSEIEM